MSQTIEKPRLTDRKRSEILAAAVFEFQKSGFEGTSMDRVAETAGASKRTVYNHFKSKEALFAAIIEKVRSRIGEIDPMPFDAKENVEQQLLGFGKEIAAVISSPDIINLAKVVISRFLHSPGLATETLKQQEEYERNLVEWIEAATANGRLDVKDAKKAAIEFIGLIEIFAFWPQVIGTHEPLTKKKLAAVVQSGAEMFLSRYQSN